MALRQSPIRLIPGGKLLAVAGFLSAWELCGRVFHIRTDLLPTPSRITLEMWKEWPGLIDHSLVTGGEILAGFLLALLLAVPVALLIGLLPGWDRAVQPFLTGSSYLPLAAAAPILLIWFGFGMTSKIFLASLLCFFPIASHASTGLRAASPDILELTRGMGAGVWQQFFKIRLPASLPDLFGGLKAATTPAVVGATIGEFVGAEEGLGYLMLAAHNKLNIPLLFAALIALTLGGALLAGLIHALERVFIPWAKGIR